MTVTALISNALIILGLVIMTIGVYGVVRLPDVYTRIHAASKSVVLGVIAILIATSINASADVFLAALLIEAVLLLTTPVGSHVIVRAAFMKKQPMETPGAVDESGNDLPTRDE